MAAANNNQSSEKAINREYTDYMYGVYLKNYWMMEVGYNASPGSVVQKTLMEWRAISDCSNGLCARSKVNKSVPSIYMTLQNPDRNSIYRPLCAHSKGSQYNSYQGDCNIYYGNCGCGYTYSNCCANAPYNLAYNAPFVIWS